MDKKTKRELVDALGTYVDELERTYKGIAGPGLVIQRLEARAMAYGALEYAALVEILDREEYNAMLSKVAGWSR